jgi:hypothetical protein
MRERWFNKQLGAKLRSDVREPDETSNLLGEQFAIEDQFALSRKPHRAVCVIPLPVTAAPALVGYGRIGAR